MPNWCSNELTIVGNPEYLQLLESKCKPDKNGKGLLNFVAPIPEELSQHSSPINDEELEAEFVEKYGAKDWYDWAVKNWGTKWDVDPYSVDLCGETLRIGFNSAWRHPDGFFEILLDKEEIESVECLYYEAGCNFGGKWIDGDDDCCDIDRAFLVNTELGQELDSMFAITEGRDEWIGAGDDVVISDEFNGQEFSGTVVSFNEEEESYIIEDQDEVKFEVPLKYVNADF